MAKKGSLTKILAVVGTVLVWIPVLAPILFAAASLIQAGMFRFDYLMPAEIFPIALAGGCLLLWAALRARARRGLIGGSLAGAVILPMAGQALASATGLASGRTEPTGWPWALVLASLALYVLALVILGVGGALLLRHLLRQSKTGWRPVLRPAQANVTPIGSTPDRDFSRGVLCSFPPSSMICTLPRSNALPTLFPSPRLR